MIRLPSVLIKLWSSLFDLSTSPPRYLARALMLDLPVALPIAFLVAFAFPTAGPDFSKMSGARLLIGICIVSPIVETLLMVVVFGVLRWKVKNPMHLAILSPLIWAGLHSLGAPAWGLGVVWPFFIFSICYLVWETKSQAHAIGMTALLHALHNLVPGVAALVARYYQTQ